MKRVTYNLFWDSLYIIITWVIILNIIGFLTYDSDSSVYDPLAIFLVGNAIAILFITIILALRLGVGLPVIPDTLYILNKSTLCFRDREPISLENIRAIFVRYVGWGSKKFTYYQIALFQKPNQLKAKPREYLIVCEPFNIQTIFSEFRFLKYLKKIGLPEDKIHFPKNKNFKDYIKRGLDEGAY